MKSCLPQMTIKYPPVNPKKIEYPLIQFSLRKKKQPLFSRVNLVYDCVDISPPHLPSIFFFFTITYRLSSHCFFTFPLGVGTIATHKFQIPIIENKSQKQKVLPTSSPMYKAKQKTNSIKKKNTYK